MNGLQSGLTQKSYSVIGLFEMGWLTWSLLMHQFTLRFASVLFL
jgi:hypothetical protein